MILPEETEGCRHANFVATDVNTACHNENRH